MMVFASHRRELSDISCYECGKAFSKCTQRSCCPDCRHEIPPIQCSWVEYLYDEDGDLVPNEDCPTTARFRILTGDATGDDAEYACASHVGLLLGDGTHEDWYITDLEMERGRLELEHKALRDGEPATEEPF